MDIKKTRRIFPDKNENAQHFLLVRAGNAIHIINFFGLIMVVMNIIKTLSNWLMAHVRLHQLLHNLMYACPYIQVYATRQVQL